MKKIRLSINFYVVFVVLMLLTAYPYIFDLLLGFPEEKVMNLIFFGIAAVIFLFVRLKGKDTLPTIVKMSIFVQLVGWGCFSAYHVDTSYFTRLFFLALAILCIEILSKKKSIYKFGYFYSNIILIQAVLGFIAFPLIFVEILDPLLIFERLERPINFYGITCSNAIYGNVVRIAGFFDEPGALASWGFFILVINKLVYNNRVLEVLLIISLLFTFSAAYFVLLPLYFLLFYSFNLKKALIILIVFIPIGIWVYENLSSNADFMWLTTERFEGGEIRSKRSIYAEEAERIFKTSMFMGVGARTLDKSFEGINDNPFEILAKDGIVGYFITYFPLLILCLKYRKKEVIFGTILLFICYQQRPFHINEMHYLMLYFYCTIIGYRYGAPALEYDIYNKLTHRIKKNESSSSHDLPQQV